jgi:hypothetical protein
MQANMGSSKPTAKHTDKSHSQGATTREAHSLASSRSNADQVDAWTETEEPEANTVQEAQPVDLCELAGEMQTEILTEQTEILAEQTSRKRRRGLVYCLFTYFLIGLAVAITLGVVFGTRGSDNNNNSGSSTDTKTSSGSGSDTSSTSSSSFLPHTDENGECNAGIIVEFQLVYESAIYLNEEAKGGFFSNWVNTSNQALAGS